MSELGYDITRGGVTVHQMPSIPFMAISWSIVANTQTSSSPFTNAGQTNELAGSRWKASFSYNQGVGKDKDIGKIRAFLAKLRGASGRFYASDASWCTKLGVLGDDSSASVTVVIPETTVQGANLFPANDLTPSETLYPNSGGGSYTYPEYTFTLSFSYDADENIYLQSDLSSGATTCTINAIDINDTFVNSNPWDYSQGVRPEYDKYLSDGMKELYKKINSEPQLNLLKMGDYIRIDDALRMVVEDMNEGDDIITFEPPLIHPATSGTQVNVNNVGVIMRLIDDEQANFNVGGGQIHESITFSAIEAL